MDELIKHLPGRLGNPEATLETDPRADRRIVDVLVATGGLAPAADDPPPADASYEDCITYCSAFEEAAALAHEAMWEAMPDYPGIASSEETIEGVDGNPITVYIDRPASAAGPLPCVLHTHGGGMVLMAAADPNFVRFRKDLASAGMVAVGVEFRNGGGKLGNHPFPAGLDDCASAARWVRDNKDALGVSRTVICGESGGGNLCLATTLKAAQEGWMNAVDGVYAMCPYISGAYANPPPELLSLTENDGYLLSCVQMAALVRVYDPTGEQARNPLAWPYHASVDQLRGLPPHVIAVNELDPLRDEGLAYYRKLTAAGVPAIGKMIAGTPHAGDQSFPDVTPDLYRATVAAIADFARSL